VRQVLATVAEAERAFAEARRDGGAFARPRLAALQAFFAAVDAGLGAFGQGKPLDPETLRNVLPLPLARGRQRA
jgi:hypothetical protein